MLSQARTHLRINSATNCHEWTRGRRNEFGYGGVWDGQRWEYTHRYFYRALVGPIPDGMVVAHRCDNPPCCNPEHLFLTDKAGNSADMTIKGRARHGWNPSPGEQNPQARLTVTQVQTIRTRYAIGGISQDALAEEFGVSQGTITDLIRRRTWAHIP